MRAVKELREWLTQFNEESQLWAYEGEVCGVIVEENKKCYCFHNELSGVYTISKLAGQKWENKDDAIVPPKVREATDDE